MVFIGISLYSGRINVYNETTKMQYIQRFKGIPQSETNISVYEYVFAHVKSGYPNIEYACLEMYMSYSNDMRKKILKCAYDHGFSNVQMVGCPAAFFLRVVTQFDVDLKPGDIVWLQYEKSMHVFENIKRRFQRVDFLDLIRMLNGQYFNANTQRFSIKIPNFVFLEKKYSVLLKKRIEEMFPNCYVRFSNDSRLEGGLLKARISAGHAHLQKYDCYPAVQDTITCFIGNRKILEIPAEQILPLKRLIPVQKKEGDTHLNIRLDTYLERVVLPPEDAFNLEFTVDENNIYAFKFLKYEPSFVIQRPLNREWIDVPNLPEIYENRKGIYKFEQNMDVVGIDLGMSKCCLAVGRRDGIKMVALGNTGSYSLPSYISFRQREPLCGEIAVKDLQTFTNFTVFDVKRIIGKEYTDVNVNRIWPFKVVDAGDEPVIRIERKDAPILFSPSQISAVLLKHIKKTAENFQGRSLKHAVITVPAAFTFSQKRDTLEAAKIAGWETIDLLHEPIAAAFSYFHNKSITSQKTVLLFDLGGGTLDLSIFKISNRQLTTIVNNGNVDLGGRDFDMILYYYFGERLLKEFGIEVFGQKKYRLLHECQDIKHRLSFEQTDRLDAEIFDITKEGYLTLSRTLFKKMSNELLSKIKDLVRETLIKATYTSDDIDMVILAGGGCRMPMITEILKEIFPKAEIQSQKNLEEVVAFGAAQYACNLLKSSDKGTTRYENREEKCSIM